MPTLAEVLRDQRRRLDQRENATMGRVTSIYDGLERDIEGRLHHVEWLIAEARREGGPVNASWLHQQTRYQILLDEVQELERLYLSRVDNALLDARMAEIRAGHLDALERTGVMAPKVGVGSVNYQAVESMAAQLSKDSPVTKILRKYGDEHQQAIEQRLLAGIANGDGVDVIVRDIMRDIGDVASTWRVRTLVRTEGMRAYRESLYEQYDQVPEVAGFVWVAARGSRTCLACLALDGQVFATREDIPGSHPNCRCSCSPEPKNMYPSVRKYLNQRGTGEEWLRRQSPEAIRRHFPTDAAYNAFMRGDVGLQDFLGRSHHPVWGTSVYQKSGRDVLAGVGGGGQGGMPVFAAGSDAVQWFSDRGVSITGATPSTDIMGMVAQGYAREMSNGGDVPAKLEFVNRKDDMIMAYSFNRYGDRTTGTMIVNTGSPYWSDGGGYRRAMDEAGWLADTSPSGLISHEVAHWRHFGNIETAGNQSYAPFYANEQRFTSGITKRERPIATRVSQYAAENKYEFIAETYAGLRAGNVYDDEVMNLFDLWGGVRP